VSAERRMCPRVDRGGRYRYHILMGHQNQRLQAVIAALPRVQQAECVHFLQLQILVYTRKCCSQVVVEREAGVPSLVLANGSHVVEGGSVNLDGAGVPNDGRTLE